MLMMAMAFPLLPGILRGGILSLLMGFGFHDTEFAICCLISAPLGNSYLLNRWMRLKGRQRA